jgi:hypothetical protein
MKRHTGIFIKFGTVYIRGIGNTGTLTAAKDRGKINPVYAMKA